MHSPDFSPNLHKSSQPSLTSQGHSLSAALTLSLAIYLPLLLGVSKLCAQTQAAAPEPSPTAETQANPKQLASHPAFAPLVNDSLPWRALCAQSLNESLGQDLSKPILLLSPLRNNQPEVNFAIRRAMGDRLNQAFAQDYSYTLASPAWWTVLDQRLFFSNQLNLQEAKQDFFSTSLYPINLLITEPEIDVIAFQLPQESYQAGEFRQLLGDVSRRIEIDPQRIGIHNRFARYGRFEMLQSIAPEQSIVDLSNLYQNIATVLSFSREANTRMPSDFVQTLFILTQAQELKPAGNIGQTQINKLNKAARELLERSWKAWEAEEFPLFASRQFLDNTQANVYSLGESCRFLLLEKEVPGGNNTQRAKKLLQKIEALFISADGRVSDQVTQLNSGAQSSLVASGWCQLHNRALLCQARIAWLGKEADLNWLKQATDQVILPKNPEFPPALSPPFPGDPDSLLGIVYVGQACIMAAQTHPQDRAFWLQRSQALFELMEHRYAEGARGYRLLPQGHPLEVPPEAFFVTTPDGIHSLLTHHGLWLRSLEAEGVEAAGKRADELFDYYTRWRLIRTPENANLYFTRGIPLQKPL